MRLGHHALLIAFLTVVPVWYAVVVLSGQMGLLRTHPPMYLLLTGLLLAIPAWVAQRDPWAAGLGGYLVIRGVFTPLDFTMETSVALIAGLAVYGLALDVPHAWRVWMRRIVVGVGSLEIALVLLHLAGIPRFSREAFSTGTIGNTNYLGVYLAISSVWVPLWLLPVWVIGIAASKSLLAGVALASVLVCRLRERWGVLAGLAALGSLWAVLRYRIHPLGMGSRLAAWELGLELWRESPIFGNGPGAWLRVIPGQQARRGIPSNGLFIQAHNEYLQLAVEGGVIALLLLCGWVWSHRASWARPNSLAALCAVGISSLAMFPFQITSTAVLALTVLAFATREGEE